VNISEDGFRNYLLSKGYDAVLTSDVISVLNNEVRSIFNSLYGAEMRSIYELSLAENVNKLECDIVVHPIFKAQNRANDFKFTTYLRAYRRYLRETQEISNAENF